MTEKLSTIRNTSKNFASLTASQLVNRFLGAIILLYMPRYLGPSDYGVYMTALSFFGLINVFSGYGLDGLFIKDVSRDKGLSQRYFCTNIVIKTSLSFLAIIAIGISIYLLSYPFNTILVILIIASATFIQSIISACSAVFKAYEKMEYNAALEISTNLFRLIGILIVIQLGGSVLWIASTIVASYFVLGLIGPTLVNKKFFKITWSTDWHFIVNSFRKSTPFFWVTALAVVQGQITLIMLSKLGNNAEVGLFSAANELTNILYSIPNVTAIVLFPIYSRQYHKSSQSLVSVSNRSIKYIAIIGLPMSAGIYMVAPHIIDLIYGAAFKGSVFILQILGLGICLLFVANTVAYILTASDRIHYVKRGNVVTVILTIGLNLWLIPIWGGVGAAYSLLISATVSFIYFNIVLKSTFEGFVIFNNIIKPLTASLIMSVILWWIGVNLFLTILLGMMIYGIILYLLKALNKDDLITIRHMIPFIS